MASIKSTGKQSMSLKNLNVKTDTSPAENYGTFQQTSGPSPVMNNAYAHAPAEQHHPAARGFGQAFGLHPALAIFTITVDAMVSVVDVTTLGISAPFLWLIASIFVGTIVFMGQRKWAGEDSESSFIKALLVAGLVALPTPFPSALTLPSAIVGTVQLLRNKK